MSGPLGFGAGGGGGSGGTVTTPVFPFIDRAVAQTIGTTGVQSLTAGTGISVSGTTTPTITNSGVTSIVAGTGITVSGATGAVTVSSSGGSAGASAITLIQRQTLSASAASVSFTSIPQTYEMLYLRIYMPGGTATSDSQIKWNNLSGYNSWRVGTRRPYGTTNTGSVDANAVTGFTNTYVSAGVGGSIGSAGSSWFQEMYLPRYTATEGKTITIHTYYGGINGTTGEDVYNTFTGGYNTNTAAITSLTLTALLTYPTGSTFALYGWS